MELNTQTRAFPGWFPGFGIVSAAFPALVAWKL